MAEEEFMNDDLESFAAALGDLTLRPTEMNRDRVLYDVCHARVIQSMAGRRWRLRLWQCATSVSTITAVIFAGLWITSADGPDHTSIDPDFTSSSEVMLDEESLQGIDLRSPASSSGNVVSVPYIRQRNRLLAEGLAEGSTFVIPDGEGASVPLTKQQILDSILDSRELGG